MRDDDPVEISPLTGLPKSRRNNDQPSSTGPLNVIGWVLIGIGVVVAIAGFCLDTTVYSPDLERVHNLGKLTTSISLVIFGTGLAIVGAIFAAAPSGRE